MEGSGEKPGEEISPAGFFVSREVVHFREVQPSDIEPIMAIERASFSSPWSARFFLDELKSPYARSLLAEIDGAIIGYALYWMLPIDADVHNLAVHPAFRRRGIGRSLLEAVVAKAREQGLTRVTLEVRQSNQAAQRLYESLGFVAQGVRKGYYSDDGEDALVMALTLPDTLRRP